MLFIKFHIILSLFCLITSEGFFYVFKEVIKKNGWFDEKDKKELDLKNRLMMLLCYFVPLLNILFVIVVFVLIGCTREQFEEYMNNRNNGKWLDD